MQLATFFLLIGTTTIEQAIRDGTTLGMEVANRCCIYSFLFITGLICTHQAKERLLQGEELDESFVMSVILEKLNSEEIRHYGVWYSTILIQ